ncbi:uncharacterized protein ARMOST_06315 [Armillaria ostoyae]|uniref:Uncharacterized protein n=1 Tax=Armillaria ostoyae TaxID=47428 RepID=A0A284R2Q1_ARMOS|nr:uncharacterized protein ARMOST_06315 [Armillaria ostoyae]
MATPEPNFRTWEHRYPPHLWAKPKSSEPYSLPPPTTHRCYVMFRTSSYLNNDWPWIPRLPEEADETKRYIAQNIQQVTEENVRYIRSYHPAFEDADLVFVYCNPSSLRESVWIVHPAFARSNAFLLDNLFVAGREVHPFEHNPPETGQPAILAGHYRPIDDPLVRTTLNPRVPLSDDDISIIRKQWPSIIGVRMYVCGAISLLLHQWEDIDKVEITSGWSTGIGGLRAQIECAQNLEPFVDRTPSFVYPFGYRHDLSLITDDALPAPTLPPGLPIITGFEPTFDAVLRPDCPLFAASYCLEDTVPVQVLGTQYTWEPNSEASDISRCLLWRSSNESDATGSVLCLGSPGAHKTRVVAFQNFEVDMLHDEGAVPLAKDQRRFFRYKGGFALPKEVLESQVVMQQPEA